MDFMALNMVTHGKFEHLGKTVGPSSRVNCMETSTRTLMNGQMAFWR